MVLKIFGYALKVGSTVLGISLLVANSTLAAQTPVERSVPDRAEQASSNLIADNTLAEEMPSASIAEITSNQMDQVTNVSQLSDVRSGDWAYEALRSLVERYGCIAGYPDGTFRGNRALTRYEFAAGLNACLQQVEKLIAASTADFASKEDIETLRRLTQEFQAELATLGARVDKLEGRVSFLEAHQFSTTTKLNAEVIIAIGDVFGNEQAVVSNTTTANPDLDVNTILSDRVRLNFDTSFTGKDRLRTRLQARSTTPFNQAITGTNMTRFGFDGNEENQVYIHRLEYGFPLGNKAKVNIEAIGGEYNDMVTNFNPLLADAGAGSISRFGRYAPIYRQAGEGTGASIDYNFSKSVGLSLGYLVPRGTSFTGGNVASNPSQGFGLFNSGYAALAQLMVKPTSNFNVGLTYVHSYNNQESGVSVSGGTGSRWANQPFGNIATSANHYGLEANYRFSPRFTLGGWAGYTTAIAEADPGATGSPGFSANIWNWAVTLGLPDLGKKGNLLAFVVGMPPKVTDNDISTREDRGTSYHLEGLYRYQVNDKIAITPGLFVVLNPEQNNNNDPILVGVIRTTFKF